MTKRVADYEMSFSLVSIFQLSCPYHGSDSRFQVRPPKNLVFFLPCFAWQVSLKRKVITASCSKKTLHFWRNAIRHKMLNISRTARQNILGTISPALAHINATFHYFASFQYLLPFVRAMDIFFYPKLHILAGQHERRQQGWPNVLREIGWLDLPRWKKNGPKASPQACDVSTRTAYLEFPGLMS